MVLGYELHRSLKAAVGSEIKFCGQRFVVSALQPPRGNRDDIALWINLAEAQRLLSHEGRINGILALECNCAANRLGQIRADIARVLPDTQVIEFGSQALARAEACNCAEAEAKEAVHREMQSRERQRQDREQLFSVLVPLIIAACALWAGLLALRNVRSRVTEIRILRA